MEVRFVGLQQKTQSAEETLHQQVDALTVTGQQQLLQRFHRYANVAEDSGGTERSTALSTNLSDTCRLDFRCIIVVNTVNRAEKIKIS